MIISGWSLKSNLQSKTIPRCFSDLVKLTTLWLKIKHGILKFSNILCACLVGSGLLKFIFHWNVQVLIFAKPLSRCLIWSYFLLQGIKMHHMQIGLESKLSDKCLMYIRKNNGPSIELLLQLRPIKSIVHLEQLFAFDIRRLSSIWLITWYIVFFQFMKETSAQNLIKGFRYVKKYTSSIVALIKRFTNFTSNR